MHFGSLRHRNTSSFVSEKVSVKMSSRLDPPEKFSFQPKDWSNWKENFLQYRLASGLVKDSDEIQISSLKYIMGPQSNEIAATFTYSDKEDPKKFQVIVEKFDAHFRPHKNVVHERYIFFKRDQQPGESADEFITALHTLSKTCEFNNISAETIRDEMIRDRIVTGISDSELSKKLQLQPKLTLMKAIEMVRAYEEVGHQAEEQKHTASSSVDRVWKNLNPSNANSCGRCGGNRHAREKCPAKNAECHKCGRNGHYASQCRTQSDSSRERVKNSRNIGDRSSKNKSERYYRRVKQIEVASDSDSSGDSFYVGRVQKIGKIKSDEFSIVCDVGGKRREFEIDTGADETIAPISFLDTDEELHKANIVMGVPGKHRLHVLGFQNLAISYEGITTLQKVYIVKGVDNALLGKPAIKALGLIRRVRKVDSSKKVEDEYSHLFKGIGKMPGEYHISLNDDTKPFAITSPRRIPFPLLPSVKNALDKMVKEKIIEPVSEPTDWVAPMVVAPKPGGRIRICVDLSQLNRHVKREMHPIPPVEETLAKLSGAVYYSKLDANSGFHQVVLAKESRKLTTFLTPFGRYLFNRLPFGISSAPEHFQARMSQILEGCTNVVCHMDDIVVFGSTEKEHDRTLATVLQKIHSAGMTLNKEKCCFRAKNIRFLGHIVGEGKIRVDPEKTKAIREMSPPTSKKELQSILGSVNFLARHIPNRSTLLEPLYSLQKEDREFAWGIAQEEAFQKLKDLLASAPVLAIYDPKKQTTVSCDASSYGLGAVLLQAGENGTPFPVAFASRTLSASEKNYAQIEKEALAVAWACERFKNYITGLKFEIETDHKPLVPILTTKFLDDLTPRLQRIRMQMMRFNYTVVHIPGKNLITADLLSRKPVSSPSKKDRQFENELQTVAIKMVRMVNASSGMLERITVAQQNDAVGKKLRQFIKEGWPDQRHETPEELLPYRNHEGSLAIENDLVLFARRIWIPAEIRPEILRRLHEGHFGITKTSALARTTVWWPKIDEDITEMVKNCVACAESRPNKSEPLLPSPLPSRPWEKIGADLLKEGGKWYLVLVDYYSKYIELCHVSRLDTKTVVQRLESVFARFGIPEVLFTDNGTQLTSAGMKEFAREFDFKIITRSPSYPQGNGLAEAAVKVAKKILRSPYPAVSLMSYRATPTSNGYSPSQLLFNRQIRTKVPSVNLDPKPVKHLDVEMRDCHRRARMKRQFDKAHGARDLKELSPGREVLVEDVNMRGTVIQKRDEPRSYDVQLRNGAKLRRNRKTLRRLPSRRVSFSSGDEKTIDKAPVMVETKAESPPLAHSPQKPPQETTSSRSPALSSSKPSSEQASSSSPQQAKTSPKQYYTKSGRPVKEPHRLQVGGPIRSRSQSDS